MNTECKKCTTDIDVMNGLYTICEGRCARRFHASCVGVSEADLCALSKNMIWICDECMDEFCKARDGTLNSPRAHSTASIAVELDMLKTAVTRINDAIARISHIIGPSDPMQRHSPPVSSIDTFHMDEPPVVSTPKSSNNTNVQTSNQSCDESFSLVLSNIDCNVTEGEIVSLVSSSLSVPGPECINVTKLVPRWKQNEKLDFISFKVVLNIRWKQIAMNKTNWPDRKSVV